MAWAGSPGADMVTPFPESYLEDQATRSVSGGCREQLPCDLRSPSRSPASKGLAFQAGSRVTWERINKLDLIIIKMSALKNMLSRYQNEKPLTGRKYLQKTYLIKNYYPN